MTTKRSRRPPVYTAEKIDGGWRVTMQPADRRRKPVVIGTFETAEDAAAATAELAARSG